MKQITKNRQITLCLALLAILIAPFELNAQALSQEQILEGLADRYRGLSTFQATYSRVAATPGTDQIFKSGSLQTATGELYWGRPAQLRLDQKSPTPELMVTDGSTVWWYLTAEKLVYRYRNIDVAGQMRPLIAFLSGLDSLNADFTVTMAPFDSQRPGQYGLKLLPKSGAEAGIDQVIVWCDGNYILTGFKLISITGESTDFYLSNFTENPQFKSDRFSFTPPRGVEIVEEGQ